MYVLALAFSVALCLASAVLEVCRRARERKTDRRLMESLLRYNLDQDSHCHRRSIDSNDVDVQ
jgi:hypothetical protein